MGKRKLVRVRRCSSYRGFELPRVKLQWMVRVSEGSSYREWAVSISVKTAENIDSANEESVVFCGHGICDSFITALNLLPNKLRRNRLQICVILIFSGQKPCENNLNNIAFFFTLFNDFSIEV